MTEKTEYGIRCQDGTVLFGPSRKYVIEEVARMNVEDGFKDCGPHEAVLITTSIAVVPLGDTK